MIHARALLAAAALVCQSVLLASGPPVLHQSQFTSASPGEAIATISARCDMCAWAIDSREAVVLAIRVDDRYVAHLPLVREGRADYRLMLGAVAAGRHTVTVQLDPELTATSLRRAASASVEGVQVTTLTEREAEHTAVALAPFVYARANTVGRFTDVPLFMWYEREPTDRGIRYRYSMIFTNEDGGTPADRLMATWGRTTDIEYLYSVEVDKAGKILADDIQGPEHEILAFSGKRDGRHPLLWVSTDNNMVLPSGTTSVRYAPAPVAFPLNDVSREAVMDANPWLYAVAAQELTREHKIAEDAPPGKGVIPDPRRFVYIEACGAVGNAALAFELDLPQTSVSSDRGQVQYRIVRDGCFRVAVPTPAGTRPEDIHRLRVNVYARPPRKGEPGRPPEPVRLDRINTMFMLDEHHRPGRSLLTWKGPVEISDAAPLEIELPKP